MRLLVVVAMALVLTGCSEVDWLTEKPEDSILFPEIFESGEEYWGRGEPPDDLVTKAEEKIWGEKEHNEELYTEIENFIWGGK